MFYRDQQHGAPLLPPPWPLVRLRLAQMFHCAPREIDEWGPDETGRVLELLSLEHQHGRRGGDGH